jgi:ribosomal protein S20
MKSARALVDLITFFGQVAQRIFEAVEKLGTEYDARSLESYVEQQVKALGAVVLETALRLRMKDRAIPDSLPCKCGHRQHCMGKHPKTVRGVLGEIELEERYYYYCDHCKAAAFLGDELRGATEFTQLAEDRMAQAGKDGAYEKASKLLKRWGIIEVAGSTLRKVCVRLGHRIRTALDRDAAQQLVADLPAEDRAACLYIGVDGTMVGRVDPQHRHRRSRNPSRKVRGKTALKNFFHEVKTLVVFSANCAGEVLRKTYYATQAQINEFREQVNAEAAKRGADRALRLVFLGDGAPWIWKMASELFPKAIQILDFYHAAEHLWNVARAAFGKQEEQVWAWVGQYTKALKEGKVEEVLAALRAVSAKLGKPDQSLTEEARERDPRWIAYRTVGYFEENRARMDYPRYLDLNLHIGSGMVESSCKHVVGARLKGPGMRWDEEGAEDILALRCHDLNERWDSLWPAKAAA